MYRSIKFIIGSLLCAVPLGCTGNQPAPEHAAAPASWQFKTLAILVEGSDSRIQHNGGAMREAEDSFTQSLLDKGYTLASRSDVAKLMQEKGYQTTQIPDTDITSIAKALNVPAVLIVSITKLPAVESEMRPIFILSDKKKRVYIGHASISARLVELSGRVLWAKNKSGSKDGDDKATAEDVVSGVAGDVAVQFPQASGK